MTKENIVAKLELIEKQKAEQLKKLGQLKEQEKTLRAQQKKKEKELTRQEDTRRKVLLGAFLLDMFKDNPTYKSQIKQSIIDFANKNNSEKVRQLNMRVLKELFD